MYQNARYFMFSPAFGSYQHNLMTGIGSSCCFNLHFLDPQSSWITFQMFIGLSDFPLQWLAFTHFSFVLFLSFVLICSVYIMDSYPVKVKWITNPLLRGEGLTLPFLYSVIVLEKFKILMCSKHTIFFFFWICWCFICYIYVFNTPRIYFCEWCDVGNWVFSFSPVWITSCLSTTYWMFYQCVS